MDVVAQENAAAPEPGARLRFVPRAQFRVPPSIAKTFYHGHHAAAALHIKTLVASIALVIECRDYRLPLSSRNPELERVLAGRDRVVVYTKADLGSQSSGVRSNLHRLHRRGDQPDAFFWDKGRPSATAALLNRIRRAAAADDSLTGLRALVVGVPNVGKSTLLNALRSKAGAPGTRIAKAAATGDQPGITRRVGTPVRIVPPREEGGVGAGVYLIDTPGVFQPYIPDPHVMVKIALTYGVKQGLVPDELIADYLLYRMNLWNPRLYVHFCPPTNDINVLLTAIAKIAGKLKRGGAPNLPEAAAMLISQWRNGKLGRYVLDLVRSSDIRFYEGKLQASQLSLNQAKKRQKEERKAQKRGA